LASGKRRDKGIVLVVVLVLENCLKIENEDEKEDENDFGSVRHAKA
jgi:hypothetical protein